MNEAHQKALEHVRAMSPDDRRLFLAWMTGYDPDALMAWLYRWEADMRAVEQQPPATGEAISSLAALNDDDGFRAEPETTAAQDAESFEAVL